MVRGSVVMWLKKTSEKAIDTSSICRKTASRQGLAGPVRRRATGDGAAAVGPRLADEDVHHDPVEQRGRARRRGTAAASSSRP